MVKFDNTWVNELPKDPELKNYSRQVFSSCWSNVMPTPVSKPELIIYSPEVADLLGFSKEEMTSKLMSEVLGGNKLWPGMVSYATCYGGHQFGNWAGQLGDGRAIYLGEIKSNFGRYELQLKGAGPTPYSRNSDGRAVLRSSIREFLCSEAMYYLGIPTTRALSLVLTGDKVVRDMFYDGNARAEPGAIVCRVSPTFTRFGHFEIFASRNDLETLKELARYTITRDFSFLVDDKRLALEPETIQRLFKEICDRTADLICHWMRVGFVHGVMNTDNMSIAGLSIDYGPYGWIDQFEPYWTPNTTDLPGRRYCFARQAEVAMWNLSRLALSLGKLLPDPEMLLDEVKAFSDVYTDKVTAMYRDKFGLDEWRESDIELVNNGFKMLYEAQGDFTIFFTLLSEISNGHVVDSDLKSIFYSEEVFAKQLPVIKIWFQSYFERLKNSKLDENSRKLLMKKVNPRFILRNYLAQQAIDKAENGDYKMVHELFERLKQPYNKIDCIESFEDKRPDWAKEKAGCSMLSCSS